MFNLFYQELRRYLPFALILMVIHSAIWAFIATQKPVLQFSSKDHFLIVIFVDGICITFGLVQYFLLKRKSYWAWLVHRPLSLSQIHYSLFGAGALLVTLAVALPFTGLIVGMDVVTNEVVEARHYWFIPHVLMMALASYALGCYVALSANKGAIACFGLLTYLSKDGAYSYGLLLSADLIALGIIFYLCHKSFKVNLNQHFTRKRDIAVAAFAMQPILAVVLWLGQVPLYHLPLVLADAHPDSYKVDQLEGTYSIVHQYTPTEYVKAVTANSNYANKESLIEQMEFAKDYNIATNAKPTAKRGQPFHIDTRHGLKDEDRGHHWSLSHHEMVLVGLDRASGEIIGYLGRRGFLPVDGQIDDQDRFKDVPALASNRYIRSKNTIYIVDFEQQTFSVKHKLQGDEHYLTGVQLNPELNLAVLITNKALYLFDSEQMLEYDQRVEAFNIVEHLRPMIEQGYLSYNAMPDGYLINYYSFHYNGHNQGGTQMVYARFDGTNEVVGELSFDRQRPVNPLVTYQHYWTSPVMFIYLGGWVRGLFQPERHYSHINLDHYIPRHYPVSIHLMMVLMIIVSVITTFLISRKIGLSRDKTYLWCGMNVFFSLPGLFAFLLMNSWWGFWHQRDTKVQP